MKQKNLKPNTYLPDFFSTIENCIGEVYYITSEGNRINLNSLMSQIFFQTTFIHKTDVSKGHVQCYKIDDYALLCDFLE